MIAGQASGRRFRRRGGRPPATLRAVDERRELGTALAGRVLCALPLAALAAWLLATARGDVDRLLLGLVCIVAVGFVIGPALAGLVADPAGSLFYPRRRALPVPCRSIAEAKRAQGRYEEALGAYETVVAEFPDDLDSWLAMVEIALLHLRDVARGDALARRALLALRAEVDRLALVRVHRRGMARLRPPPAEA